MTEEIDWSQFVPDIDPPLGGLNGGLEIIKELGVVAAYRKWCGKSDPSGSRTESIMISCPFPNHPDKNPSAFANSDKDVWFCAACQKGGDIVDLGAIHFGKENYKDDGKIFVELLEQMLESMGVDVQALREKNAIAGGGTPVVEIREEEAEAEEEEEEEFYDEPLDQLEIVPLEWERICARAPDSFLASWMKAFEPSTVPNEYLFWEGVQMVGLACARDLFLSSGTPVYPNFLVALIGPTGLGKSRSISFSESILGEALPFDADDPSSRGVQLLGRPGSGEALYEMFSWEPNGFGSGAKPTRGLVDIDELSELMSAGNRKGSTLREAVIALSDNRDKISHTTRSSTVEAVEPFMSLITGGQPDAMSRIMDSQDAVSGFANRFLFVDGTPKQRPKWGSMPVLDSTGVADKLTRIKTWAGQRKKAGENEILIPDTISAAAGHGAISPAEKFDQTLEWLDEVRSRPNGDMFARLELYAMKLVVVLSANAHQTEATPEVIDDVHHLIETIVPSTGAISESISKTEEAWYRDKVITCIEKAKANGRNPPTRSDLTQSIHSLRRDKYKLGTAITQLERAGVVQRVQGPKPAGSTTPPADRWKLS